ncbi:two-component system response regulator TorR [Aeromonas media]|uniref:Two-component system response regulator TorR n=1 Tax=Aeromonas media TaxID=651 RepID=A0A6M4YCB8_AERME|nr:two-component system response regulator TorR [Aeromonas media]QJT20932.1 two-component system response regulator TorR [Aeromonas media]QYK81593.1 two-component system response regulator TorR [Aeromonas media]
MSYHILVVEDDAVTREKLTGYFEREGYRVTAVENGQEIRAVLADQTVDLVMLDINLPGEDGLLLTRELRARSTVGIILVTGRSDAVDRIVGLEMGADDYVTKPFELRELLVRVKNLLWRISLATAAPSEPAVADDAVRFGPWRFDIPRRQLSKDGVPVRLTKAEYEVLVAFVAHPGRVLSRERILTLISHRGDGPSDRTIDVLIRRLRGKMELDPRDPQLFVTVHGEGYLFAGELAP